MAMFAQGAAALCISTAVNKDWKDNIWTATAPDTNATCNTGSGPAAGSSVVIASGSNILVDTNTLTVANVTINSGGTLQGKVNNTLSLTGNLTNGGGTFTAGSGTVALVGSTTQTISGTFAFSNLTLSNPAGVTISGTVSVTGAFTPGTTPVTVLAGSTLTINGVLYTGPCSGIYGAGYCTAPSVTAINTASGNPTAAASVSWTVTFNTSVAGLNSGNFTLVSTGLGGAPAITSVAGSGATWTVTASTGTGTGTLGLNMTSSTGVTPAVTGLPFTGQVYSVRPPTPVTYYHDTTAGMAIGFDGATNVVSGTNVTIPPVITASLVKTSACTGNARSANHPTGTYTQSRWYLNANYAVDTSIGANPAGSARLRGGAATDTVIVRLYDYDPVSGAKLLIGSSAPITLTTFNTTTSYPYTISSPVYTVVAGHRLMLQYDFNQPVATYNARVYCSATGAYITVIETPTVAVAVDHYELSLPTASLACLPSTVTVTACKDSSSPCTNKSPDVSGKTATLATNAGMLAAATVTFNAAGVASTTLSYPAAVDGAAVSVSLFGEQAAAVNLRKCCPDGASCAVANSCSTTFNTAGFLFSAAANGAAATIPSQIAGTSSATYYLRAVKTNTATMACQSALAGAQTVNFAYECIDPTTCYAANLMSVNGGAATTIARNNNGSVASYTGVNMTFDANGNAPFTFNYGDVGQVKLHASKAAGGALLSALTGSTNAFVTAPGGFVLSGISQTAAPNLANPAAANAAGAKFVKAGEAFSVTATAVTSTGSVAYNYGRENSPESVRLTPALVAGLGLTNNPAVSGAFGAFGKNCSGVADPAWTGMACGTAFAWNEVGIIKLTPGVADGNYLGAGDVVGTQTGNVGRFYAAKFALSGGAIANRTALSGCTVPAGCGTFTYIGEPMSAVFSLIAKAADGTTTLQNYAAANQFAKLDPLAAVTSGTGGPLVIGAVDSSAARTPFPPCGGGPVHPCLTAAQATSGTFASGVASVTVPLAIYRDNAVAAGPYAVLDIGIAPQDGDGAAMAAYDLDTVNVVAGANNHAKVGRTEARYGRLKLSNAHGSELLPLPISVTAQYWNGATYVTNALDSHSSFAASDVIFSNPQKNLAVGETSVVTPPAAVVFSSGVAGYQLARPSGGDGKYDGSLDMAVNIIAAYLPSNTARATFGVYKGNNEFIYLRESY
ncbi:MAG: G8 domain-containing protein [Nitrosomonadales bacterium]|nr:G8 domain-containing protein [Nitrosomonadales bacterium]